MLYALGTDKKRKCGLLQIDVQMRIDVKNAHLIYAKKCF